MPAPAPASTEEKTTDETGVVAEGVTGEVPEGEDESSSDSDSDIESDEEQKDSEKVRIMGLLASFVKLGLVYCTRLSVVNFKWIFNARSNSMSMYHRDKYDVNHY